MNAEDFWEAMRDRWWSGTEEERRAVTHHVLLHLRRQLPREEAARVFGLLPPELTPLAAEGPARPERLDAPAFYAHVGREAHVPPERAAEATEAAFGVLRGGLPPPTAARVERQLPPGLRALWRAAA